MALLWCDDCGDHYGDTNISPNGANEGVWSVATCAATVVSGRTGNAIAIVTPNGFSSYYGYLVKNLLSDYSRLIIGAAAFIVANTASQPIMSTADNGTSQVSVLVGSLGQVIVATSLVNQSTTSPTPTVLWQSAYGLVTPGSYHHFGMDVTHKSDSTGSVSVYLEGDLLHTVTGVRTTTTANEYGNQVRVYGVSTAIDDVFIFDGSGGVNDSFPGDRAVIYDIVNGNGPTNDFTIGGSAPAATNWQSVNGAAPYHATKFVIAGALNDIDTYSIPALDVSVADIDAVMIVANMKTDESGGTAKMKSLFVDGGSPVLSADEKTLTTDDLFYYWTFDENPLTSAAWDPADLPTNIGLKRTG